jgi:glycosyltransferase involved in cell wall biosynthesis
MLIAVNTRMLIRDKMEGIGYFTYETMRRLTHQHPEHEFLFIFDRPFDESFIFSGNIKPVPVFPPARHPALWYLWYEWALPSVFRKYKPDLFISTDGYLPLSSPVPALAVFHDLNFEHFPKDLPLLNRMYYRYFFPRFAREAARIAAVSEFTRNDIIQTYRVDPAKIDVVYNGVNEKFNPASAEKIQATRNKFSRGNPYFLFVGALHARKNIANLLRAFDLFRSSTPSAVQLILTGQKRWWTEEMENAFRSMEHKSSVIFTGRMEEAELIDLTASALALTYVSVFEGFGIPIVEAMRCGVPVITSNVTSMPEISGGAAQLCDPFHPASICEAMTRVFADEPLRKSLIAKGHQRQEYFSWDRTAIGLWNSLEKLF